MNYEFHQLTILLDSMKNWTPPRVNSEILIEKTSLSSWVQTPVLAFLSESRFANENCHQMKSKSNLNRWPRPNCTYCEAVRGCFLKKHIIWTISVTAGKFAPKKKSYYGRMVRALDLKSNGLVSTWVRTPVGSILFENCSGVWVCHRKQTNDSFERIKTVKWFDELWISSAHNPFGFNKELKSSASKLRNSHWKSKLLWPNG